MNITIKINDEEQLETLVNVTEMLAAQTLFVEGNLPAEIVESFTEIDSPWTLIIKFRQDSVDHMIALHDQRVKIIRNLVNQSKTPHLLDKQIAEAAPKQPVKPRFTSEELVEIDTVLASAEGVDEDSEAAIRSAHFKVALFLERPWALEKLAKEKA